MISIRSLSKKYGKVQALNDVTLEIRPGRITGVVGPNACGKSTLIKSILGLVRPDSGEIRVNGQPICDESYRGLLGYMPQVPNFPENLSGNELLRLFSSIRVNNSRAKEELVKQFELQRYLDKPLVTLSTGTKQKVSAVAALMFEPALLILDEPTAGFDPLSCSKFKELIQAATRRGATVVIVSHIMSELEQLVNDVVFMLEGKLVFSGAVEDLASATGVHGVEQGIVKLMSANIAIPLEHKSHAAM